MKQHEIGIIVNLVTKIKKKNHLYKCTVCVISSGKWDWRETIKVVREMFLESESS